eukprot:NODE_3095_length_2094_cov_2.388409.p1 GENE.NODE_3095_length_2094_cov_2.388409~~NODE_3095_length_2094_cov_2.388409.p1  ORF type:complete len:622 (+),score=211.17 NODE_3095_length_2094_cov_2.388409:49-1914(+)
MSSSSWTSTFGRKANIFVQPLLILASLEGSLQLLSYAAGQFEVVGLGDAAAWLLGTRGTGTGALSKFALVVVFLLALPFVHARVRASRPKKALRTCKGGKVFPQDTPARTSRSTTPSGRATPAPTPVEPNHKIIKAAMKEDQFDVVMAEFERIRVEGTTNSTTYDMVVYMHARHGKADKISALIAQMLDEHLEPRPCTYRTAFVAWAEAAGTEVAEQGANQVVKMLQEKGLDVSAVYQEFAVALTKSGDVARLERLLEKMVNLGEKPSEETIMWLIGNHVKAGRIARVQELHEDFASVLTKGRSFSALISVTSRAGDFEAASGWLAKMKDAGFEPDVWDHNTVLGACVKLGEVGSASAWMEAMDAAGLPLDMYTFNHMLSVCAKAGDVDTATRTLAKLECAGLAPDAYSYNSALGACARAGDITTARRWLARMEAAGVQLDIYTFSTLLSTCAKAGSLSDLFEWMSLMKRHGIEADIITCNTILNACATAGDLARCERLFENFQTTIGMPPNSVTYAIMAKACAAAGNVARIESLEKEMLNRGVPLSEHFVCSHLTALGAARPWRPEVAEEVFHHAREAGIEVNRPMLLALSRAVGWSRCDKLVGQQVRRRLLLTPRAPAK